MPPEIISAQTFSQIDRMITRFSDFAASEYIMETCLNAEAAEADFSFRIVTRENRRGRPLYRPTGYKVSRIVGADPCVCPEIMRLEYEKVFSS